MRCGGQEKGDHAMRRHQQFARWSVLAVLAALVLGLTARKAEQNAMRRARFHERDVKLKATAELGQEVNRRVQMAFMAGVTFDRFSKEFGAPVELKDARDPRYADMTHSLFHEKSQRTYYLRFADGKLMGFRSNYGFDDIDTGVVLETPAFLRSESVRISILSGGLLAWCVALVVALRAPRFRRKTALVLVAASLICGLCWFLDPSYSPTLSGISSNDNLFFFALMLIASLGLVAMTPPRDRDPDGKDGLHSLVAH
jgi:hypothetical protein